MGRVEQVVKNAIEAQAKPGAGVEKKVTLRVGGVEYYRLHKVAELMGVTKTRCAEELLEAAILEAFEAAGIPWEQGDVVEFYGDLLDEVSQQELQERWARELQGQKLVEGQVA